MLADTPGNPLHATGVAPDQALRFSGIILAKDKTVGRAEALRQGMLAVMADTTRPKGWVPASHPAVWAPFVVVGEGGAGR